MRIRKRYNPHPVFAFYCGSVRTWKKYPLKNLIYFFAQPAVGGQHTVVTNYSFLRNFVSWIRIIRTLPADPVRIKIHITLKQLLYSNIILVILQDINGASFAGFYYICFQKSSSSVEGYYFHRNSEWWAHQESISVHNLGWVNLYQKFEIKKYTVCGKLILPKKWKDIFKKIFWHNWLADLHGFANICKLPVSITFKDMQSKIW